MARLYLRVEASLPRHPKVRQLAEMFGLDPVTGPHMVVGFLVEWWGYCAEFGSDARPADCPRSVLRGFSASLMRAASLHTLPEIDDALRSVGLMDRYGHPHDWQDYTGLLLAQRAKDAERKRTVRGQSAPTVQDSTGQGEPTSLAVRKEALPYADDLRDLGELLGREQYRQALHRLVTGAASPVSLLASIRACGVGGIHECGTWDMVGRALFDLAAVGGAVTPAALRAFIRRAKTEMAKPAEAPKAAGSNPFREERVA